MDIQKYIVILEEHRDDLAYNKGYPTDAGDVIEALDFAIDGLKAVDESLKEE